MSPETPPPRHISQEGDGHGHEEHTDKTQNSGQSPASVAFGCHVAIPHRGHCHGADVDRCCPALPAKTMWRKWVRVNHTENLPMSSIV